MQWPGIEKGERSYKRKGKPKNNPRKSFIIPLLAVTTRKADSNATFIVGLSDLLKTIFWYLLG